MMSKNVILLAISTLIVNFCIAQTKSLSAFNSIHTSGNVQVTLVKSDENKVEYTITKGRESDLIIDVEGQNLNVKIKTFKSFINRSETKANVTIYYKNLSAIDCSAGSSVSSKETITSDAFAIETSSGSKCSVSIKSKDISASSSSGSSLNINGSSNNATFDASSGARISASEFQTTNATADASSGASIKLFASKKLTADASSGGSIQYKGKPESLNVDTSALGSISSF